MKPANHKPIPSLVCPYPNDCGQKFAASELNDYDFDFLQSATAKKMRFMFIDCPRCHRQFQFNTVAWKATAMSTGSASAKPIKKHSPRALASLLKKLKIPPPYLEHLQGDGFKSEILIIKGQSKFHLHNGEELCEIVNIDGHSQPRATELKAYAHSLKKYFTRKARDPFSLPELSKCISIGCENERILFLDYRDNNTLWIFHPDGADVEPVKMTLDKIIKKTTTPTPRAKRADPPPPAATS